MKKITADVVHPNVDWNGLTFTQYYGGARTAALHTGFTRESDKPSGSLHVTYKGGKPVHYQASITAAGVESKAAGETAAEALNLCQYQITSLAHKLVY